MAKLNQEGDYFVPTLAPYVQWVQAYGHLICALYEEHKTVKRTWKAFKDEIPGVEQRLEFDVFEQILLFSLFLSECNESNSKGGSDQEDRETKRSSMDLSESHVDNQLDTVIQELRNTSAERDRALWNVKHLEEDSERLTARKDELQRQVDGLKENLDKVQNELGESSANFNMVAHELDNQRAQNASLQEKYAVLKDTEASLEEQVKRLMERSVRVARDKSQSQSTVAVKGVEAKPGPSQMAMWVRQDPKPAAGRGVIQDLSGEISAKKIAGWNVQRSKDGYYRVYRKIRGKVRSIYIGRDLDIEKANRRIAEKEKELR
jgi:chromosome segregation ATPase